MTRRVHIKTWGCQMNVYDSERMAELLAASGYEQTSDPAEADLLLLNTCHIREKAAEKLYSEIGRLKPLKSGARQPLIAVAGCVAQAEGAEIPRRAPSVDLVIGPQSYQDLPALLAEAERRRGPQIATEFPAEPKFDLLPEETRRATGPTAFLAVQEGCDKFCSFCVVPYTRGAEYSRPAAAVLAEARRLAESGAKEVTLLGQNVNAWAGAAPDGDGVWDLARLLAGLAEIPGLERLRYTTSHPNDMTEALIRAHGDNPKLMPYLHLPVQAGSDRVLAAMNRKHTAESYRRIIDRLRQVRPDIAISGDFIVGFPGETREDFRQTLALVSAVEYATAYSFKYSPRPGTPAADRADQVPEGEKAERLQALQQLLTAQAEAFQARFVGREVTVLADRKGRRPGQLAGRSPWNLAVHVEAPAERLGQILPVVIESAHEHGSRGRLV